MFRLTKDNKFDTLAVLKQFEVPVYADIPSFPGIPGSIIYVNTTRLLYYWDSTQWMQLDAGTGMITIIGRGTGQSLFNPATSTGISFNAKSISAGSSKIIVNSTSTDITVDGNYSLAGTGVVRLVSSLQPGPNFSVLGLNSDSTIGLVPGPNDITIKGNYTLTSAGSATSLVDATSLAPAFKIKSLSAGSGISFDTSTPGQVMINSTGLSSVVLQSAPGGVALLDPSPQSSSPYTISSLTSGTGISITTTPGSKIVNIAGTYQLNNSSALGGVSLIFSGTGTGPVYALNKLAGANGINISASTGLITIAQANSILTSLPPPGESILPTFPTTLPGTVSFKRIAAGSSNTISVVTTGGAITLDGQYSLNNASGGGTSLIGSGGAGPAYTLKTLAAGTDISFDTSTSGQIKINASGASSVQLQSSGAVGGTPLVVPSPQSGPTLTIQDLKPKRYITFDTVTTTGAVMIDCTALDSIATRSWAAGSSSNINSNLDAIAIGNTATVNINSAQAISIGSTALVNQLSDSSIAIGYNAQIGTLSVASPNSISIGQASSIQGSQSVALGDSSQVIGNTSIAIGATAVVNGASTTLATAIGFGALASASWATAIGEGTIASGPNSSALGEESQATANSATAVGGGAKALFTDTTAVGISAKAELAIGATALGKLAHASGTNSLAMGTSSVSSAANSIAVGTGATSSNTGSIAVGGGAVASASNSMAIGTGVSNATANTALVGSSTAGFIFKSTGYLKSTLQWAGIGANFLAQTFLASTSARYSLDTSIYGGSIVDTVNKQINLESSQTYLAVITLVVDFGTTAGMTVKIIQGDATPSTNDVKTFVYTDTYTAAGSCTRTFTYSALVFSTLASGNYCYVNISNDSGSSALNVRAGSDFTVTRIN